THIGDLVAAVPVFVDGAHRFWSVARAHQLDVRACLPTSLPPAFEDVYQEGLVIPPLKRRDRGPVRRDAIDLYLTHLRYRDLLAGDLLAQLACVDIGRLRLEELCASQGMELIDDLVEEMIAYASRRTAEAIRAMPDGRYVGHSWMDGSGFDEEHVHIQATVT